MENKEKLDSNSISNSNLNNQTHVSREIILIKQNPKSSLNSLENTTTGVFLSNSSKPVVLDWDSPEDPENPKNWSSAFKWYTTLVVASMVLVGTFGSSIYVPSTDLIMQKFHVSKVVSLLGLSVYILGCAFGPLHSAPLSEVFGRQPIYLICLPSAALFSVGVAQAKNFGTILVCRFFSGAFLSPALALGGGSIVDIWNEGEVNRAMNFFAVAPYAGPICGPIVGSFIAQKMPWNWVIYVHMMICGFSFVFVIFLKETFKPVILRKKYKRRNLPVPPLKSLNTIIKQDILRPCVMLATDPIVFLFSFYLAFIFAILFGFFEAFPYIFENLYNFNQGQAGLTFLGIGIGILISSIICILIDKYYLQRRRKAGKIKEEDQLLCSLIGAVLLPIGLFWLGWSANPSVPWIVPVLSGVPFGISVNLLYFSLVAYIAVSFSENVQASSIAAINFLRYALSAAFPLFTVQMYKKLSIGWASSLLGFIAIGLIPVPFAFFYFGKTLRRLSYYARVKLAEKEVRFGKETI